METPTILQMKCFLDSLRPPDGASETDMATSLLIDVQSRFKDFEFGMQSFRDFHDERYATALSCFQKWFIYSMKSDPDIHDVWMSFVERETNPQQQQAIKTPSIFPLSGSLVESLRKVDELKPEPTKQTTDIKTTLSGEWRLNRQRQLDDHIAEKGRADRLESWRSQVACRSSERLRLHAHDNDVGSSSISSSTYHAVGLSELVTGLPIPDPPHLSPTIHSIQISQLQEAESVRLRALARGVSVQGTESALVHPALVLKGASLPMAPKLRLNPDFSDPLLERKTKK